MTPFHDPAGPAGERGRPEHPGDLLSAYLDDELAPGATGEVEAHLDACPACRSELDELAGARRALRSLPHVEPPPTFVAALVESRKRVDRRATAVALVAASVAVVAGLLTAPTTDGVAEDDGPRLALSAEGHERRPSGGAPGRDPESTDGNGPVSMTAAHPNAVDLGDDTEAPPEATADDEGGEDDDSWWGRVGDTVSGLLEAIGG